MSVLETFNCADFYAPVGKYSAQIWDLNLSYLIPSPTPVAIASGLGVFEFLALLGREFRLV
jgi:hypothetical protein